MGVSSARVSESNVIKWTNAIRKQSALIVTYTSLCQNSKLQS